MTTPPQRAKTFDALWLAFFLVASSLWCLAAARTLGVAGDEPFYVGHGLGWWRGETFRVLNAGTMPLPIDVQTLPLFLWEKLSENRFNLQSDFYSALHIARAFNLIFWWVLLVYAWRIGRDLAGRWGGNFAVAFLACEPTFLAHASLATTDISATACLLGFAFHYRVGRNGDWKTRVAWPLFWLFLTCVSKASGQFYAIAIVLVIEAENARKQMHVLETQSGQKSRRFAREFLGCIWSKSNRRDWWQLGAGALLLTLLYCGNGGATHPAFVQRAGSTPGLEREVWAWLAQHARIYPTALDAWYFQMQHNAKGHPWFLLGMSDEKGWIWFYFPVALAIKSSLLLLVAGVGVLWIKPRALFNWASVCALLFLVMSLFHHVQNGVRQMMPLMALAIIALAAAWAQVEWKNARLPIQRWTPMALIALMAAQAVWIWPHGLLHINALWGGSENGYRLLSSSNYDWGQGLPELDRWQRQYPEKKLVVWCIGRDPFQKKMNAEVWSWDFWPADEKQFRARLKERYLAVGTSILYGSYENAVCNAHRCNPAIAVLRKMQPVDRTATFLIFDFTKP